MTYGDKVMAAENTGKSFWKGIRAEYKKIVWPSREDLVKQSIAVMAGSVVTGAIIAVLDLGIQYGVNFLTSLPPSV